ncbi:MAG TPA: hypothetical protein VHL98_00510 [Microvirga sp.]|jgi:hypothetical protein|nr:hypothetical protein [Microvirga sp.]
MSQDRQSQWSRRIARLQAMRERFAGRSRYDRADRAHRAIQHVYERWADEVFAAVR